MAIRNKGILPDKNITTDDFNSYVEENVGENLEKDLFGLKTNADGKLDKGFIDGIDEFNGDADQVALTNANGKIDKSLLEVSITPLIMPNMFGVMGKCTIEGDKFLGSSNGLSSISKNILHGEGIRPTQITFPSLSGSNFAYSYIIVSNFLYVFANRVTAPQIFRRDIADIENIGAETSITIPGGSVTLNASSVNQMTSGDGITFYIYDGTTNTIKEFTLSGTTLTFVSNWNLGFAITFIFMKSNGDILINDYTAKKFKLYGSDRVLKEEFEYNTSPNTTIMKDDILYQRNSDAYTFAPITEI